eukprot:364834-Chlamydomonas_euryale.AAC.5
MNWKLPLQFDGVWHSSGVDLRESFLNPTHGPNYVCCKWEPATDPAARGTRPLPRARHARDGSGHVAARGGGGPALAAGDCSGSRTRTLATRMRVAGYEYMPSLPWGFGGSLSTSAAHIAACDRVQRNASASTRQFSCGVAYKPFRCRPLLEAAKLCA